MVMFVLFSVGSLFNLHETNRFCCCCSHLFFFRFALLKAEAYWSDLLDRLTFLNTLKDIKYGAW